MKIQRLLAPLVGAILLGLSVAPASAQCNGTPSANSVCAGPASGGAGQFRARAIVPADLPIGTAVQAWDADLDAIAGLTTAADKLQFWTGSHTAALIDFPSWARSVVSAANASAGRTAFGLAIGTDVQAYDAELAAIAGLTSANNKCFYWTGSGTAATYDCSSFGRGLVNAADASAARTAIGAVIGTDVQAFDSDLSAVAALSSNGLVARTGAGTAATRTITSPAAGITVSNGDGVSGNPTLALANDLAALEGLSGTGIARRTGTDAWSAGTAVANSELANMSNATFKCRNTSGSGAPEDCTATQATALLNAMVGDSGSGGTKGLVGAPASGDGAAGKYWRADGVWAVPPGSGGGSLPDDVRQNVLLNSIYLSKALGEPRRTVNAWATGFKAASDTARGINAGSSSNYDTTNSAASGYIAQTASSDTYATVNDPTLTGDSGSNTGLNTRLLIAAAQLGSNNGDRIRLTLRASSASGNVGVTALWICHKGAVAPNCDSAPVQATFNGGSTTATITQGNTLVTDPIIFAFDKTKDFLINFEVTGSMRFVSGGATGWTRYTKSTSGESGLTSVTGYASDAPVTLVDLIEVRTSAGTTNNMTLVTASQTTDSSVGNGRVIVEYDPLVSITLNTDLTVEVTCNGGANWASASLSAVTAYSGGVTQRRLAESVNQACSASGTSFAARIKSLNNKAYNLYGASMTVNWLLKRDLAPAGNDNTPMWLNIAA